MLAGVRRLHHINSLHTSINIAYSGSKSSNSMSFIPHTFSSILSASASTFHPATSKNVDRPTPNDPHSYTRCQSHLNLSCLTHISHTCTSSENLLFFNDIPHINLTISPSSHLLKTLQLFSLHCRFLSSIYQYTLELSSVYLSFTIYDMSYGPWIGDNSLVSPSTMAHPTLALSASLTPSPTPSSIPPSITFLSKKTDGSGLDYPKTSCAMEITITLPLTWNAAAPFIDPTVIFFKYMSELEPTLFANTKWIFSRISNEWVSEKGLTSHQHKIGYIETR